MGLAQLNECKKIWGNICVCVLSCFDPFCFLFSEGQSEVWTQLPSGRLSLLRETGGESYRRDAMRSKWNLHLRVGAMQGKENINLEVGRFLFHVIPTASYSPEKTTRNINIFRTFLWVSFFIDKHNLFLYVLVSVVVHIWRGSDMFLEVIFSDWKHSWSYLCRYGWGSDYLWRHLLI